MQIIQYKIRSINFSLKFYFQKFELNKFLPIKYKKLYFITFYIIKIKMYRQNFNNDTIFNSESLENDDEYNSPSSKKNKIVNTSPRYGYDHLGNNTPF